jgi:hypothetical protein
MRSRGWQIGALLATALVALAASGCDTGTDYIATGNGFVRITVAQEGDTIRDWDCILFNFDEVRYLPKGGTCSGGPNAGEPCYSSPECGVGGTCVGSYAEGLIGTSGVVAYPGGDVPPAGGNLLDALCPGLDEGQDYRVVFTPPDMIVLSEELYEINEFEILQLGLFDDDGTQWTCATGTSVVDAFDLPLRFRVPADGDKPVVFSLDVAELERRFADVDGAGTDDFCGALEDYLDDIMACETCEDVP